MAITPRIGLLLLLPCFAGFPANASNWKQVAGDEKTRVEIDVASLARSGNVVKAWERETHHTPEQAKPGDFFFTSVKTLAQHHCTDRTTIYLFRVFFAADGSEIKAIGPGTDLGNVDFLVPDSIEERKLIFACAYKPGIKKPAKTLTQPVSTEKAAEPPAPSAKQNPTEPAEKGAQKGAPPAKSAEKGGKVPVEDKRKTISATKSVASAQPSSTPPGKTLAGK